MTRYRGRPTVGFPARYRRLSAELGGDCPIEAGALGRLADNECSHGRLPGDQTPACGCWPQEITREPLPIAESLQVSEDRELVALGTWS